ncbi:MAG: efflux RND transporter periplasmic adaptor subunit [Acidobacteria bacterium]|nr:efflux RND transporter periplasmic adaptor subunit [Acidobacteriota bacterium]
MTMMANTKIKRIRRFAEGTGLVLVLALTLVGCKGAEDEPAARNGRPEGRRPGGPEAAQGGPGGRPPLPTAAVAVEQVRRGDIATYYSATASLDPNKEADVLARVNGIIQALAAEEGDRVAEGQVLIEIEDAEYRHRVTQAEVELHQQRLQLERSEKMLAQGLVSAEDADAARSQMKAAEASWELATLELSYTRVQSPFKGRVIARSVDQGRTVSNGTVLFTLADLSRLLARVHVPAREFRNIQTDQPVQLVVDSTGDRLEGHILLVSPVVDSTSGTIKVTVEITDFPSSTRPGDFAEVSIVTDRHDDVLVVPRIAVLRDHEERVVYVADGDTAVRRVVEIGFEDDRFTEVIAGLGEGESVVVQGQRSLADGQKISILDKLNLGGNGSDATAPSEG